MQKFYVYAAALILVFSLLIGCGGGTQTVNVQSLDSGIKQEGKSEKMNDLLLKSAMAKPAD